MSLPKSPEQGYRQSLERVEEALGPVGEPVRKGIEVVVQSVKDMLTDSGPQWAAAIAYYALLSVFPLFVVAAAIASLFVDPQWAVDRITSMLGDFVPQEGTIRDTVQSAIQSRGQVGLIAFAGLVWTGTRVFGTLTRAMNIAFDADDSYGFWKRFLIEAIMVLTIGVFFVLALASGFLTGLVWEAVQFLPARENAAFALISGAVRGAMILLAFFLIYRFVPRSDQDWRSSLAGAIVATGLFLVASPLFQYYVGQFGGGRYNLIYGSMAVAIVLLIWVWIASLITIFGGEIASHVKSMVIEGKSAEEVQQQHEARSPAKKRASDASRQDRHDGG